MEGNDWGLRITWQPGKYERRGRDYQKRRRLWWYVPVTAGIQVEGEEARRSRAQVVRAIHTHTRTLLAAIPLPLFQSFFKFFFFFFIIHFSFFFFFFFLLQIGFFLPYSLAWTVAFLGWCERLVSGPARLFSFLSRGLQQTPSEKLSTCRRDSVKQTHKLFDQSKS